VQGKSITRLRGGGKRTTEGWTGGLDLAMRMRKLNNKNKKSDGGKKVPRGRVKSEKGGASINQGKMQQTLSLDHTFTSPTKIELTGKEGVVGKGPGSIIRKGH